MPTTSWPRASSRSARCEPMKPAAPVTTTLTEPSILCGALFSIAVKRFEAWLAEAGIGIGGEEFPEGARTAAYASRAIGGEVGQIVKSLVFVAGGRPVVALVSGSNRLDEHRLGAVAGTPVRKADAETARTATGYSIGGVPPFGHASEVPVFMDRDLLGHEVVWAAAGRPDSVFEIAPERLRELSQAEVADLKAVTS